MDNSIRYNKNYKIDYFHEEIEKEQDEGRVKNQKEKIFDIVINHLFDQCIPTEGKEPLAVSGYILLDGKGDYAHLSKMVQKLHKKFPDRPIKAIIISATSHEGQLSPIQVENCETYLSFYGEGISLGSPEVPIDRFSPEILDKIKTAALWITGPISIGGKLEDLDRKPDIGIFEYDTWSNRGNYQQGVLMGLGRDSANGIFIKKQKDYAWKDLENIRLKQILFNTTEITQEKIDQYLDSKSLYFCYMNWIGEYLGFIINTAAYSQANEREKAIDICFRCKSQIKALEKMLKDSTYAIQLSQLRKLGIGSIRIVYYERDEKKESLIKLQEMGKELRIIDVGFLAKRDFNRIAYLSGPLMACTGDNSLGLALSLGKVPYYEMASHKRYLANNLIQLINEKCGKNSVLGQYVRSGTLDEPNIAAAKDPQLAKQAREFGEFIRENFSFDPYFTGMVNGLLFRKMHPDYANYENKIRERYINGESSLDETEKLIKDELARRKILKVA